MVNKHKCLRKCEKEPYIMHEYTTTSKHRERKKPRDRDKVIKTERFKCMFDKKRKRKIRKQQQSTSCSIQNRTLFSHHTVGAYPFAMAMAIAKPSAALFPRPRPAVSATVERTVFSWMASVNVSRALACSSTDKRTWLSECWLLTFTFPKSAFQ